jgi:hypothetical protein
MLPPTSRIIKRFRRIVITGSSVYTSANLGGSDYAVARWLFFPIESDAYTLARSSPSLTQTENMSLPVGIIESWMPGHKFPMQALVCFPLRLKLSMYPYHGILDPHCLMRRSQDVHTQTYDGRLLYWPRPAFQEGPYLPESWPSREELVMWVCDPWLMNQALKVFDLWASICEVTPRS